MADILEAVNIRWHPGFYGAAELEFLSNKGDLEFQREFNLSKEPIRMDLLIIKTVGYACIYKGLGETVDQIPAGELTISIFRESYPRELFEAMKNLGLKIKERYPGIYYISGKQAMFDTQVVVTKQLDKKTHSTLRVLSKHVKEEDIRPKYENGILSFHLPKEEKKAVEQKPRYIAIQG